MKNFIVLKILSLYFLLSILSCYLLTSTKYLKVKENPINSSRTSQYKAYWIGHATVLIKMNDKWILTDPIWNDNLLFTIGRHVEPGINIDELPPIDFIAISHVHLDHMDTFTLKKLSKNAHLILPKGSPNFKSYGFKEITYVEKGDSITKDNLKITSVAAQHFGGRWAIDNFWDGEPYTGYIFQNENVTVYFAGDTGYNSKDFKELGQNYKIDLALIPFGPYRGKIFGNDLGNYVHVSPKGAIQLFKDTNAKILIPIHHGTFYASPEKEIEFIRDAIHLSGISNKVYLLEQGQGLVFGP